MTRLVPFAALLLLGGCGASDGDRGQTAPADTLQKPISQEEMDKMPAEARKSAEQSMEAGKAMKEQMDKRYGGGR